MLTGLAPGFMNLHPPNTHDTATLAIGGRTWGLMS